MQDNPSANVTICRLTCKKSLQGLYAGGNFLKQPLGRGSGTADAYTVVFAEPFTLDLSLGADMVSADGWI